MWGKAAELSLSTEIFCWMSTCNCSEEGTERESEEKMSQNCIFPGSWPLASNSGFACVFFIGCMRWGSLWNSFISFIPQYFTFAKVHSLWSLKRTLLSVFVEYFLSKEDFRTQPNIFLLGSYGFLAFPKENAMPMCVLVPHNPCFN